ncbi:type IV toxin-antitoxin system AbiEi family antitoxin [Flavobacterium sp.]|jgi:hypothetical protein|uniref:type IV toxin-antitoxin system AbiEi family antitoxin n=1 Tax=Flavobacterium sp. TaxID=239 RepID=UPI003783E664
MNNIKELENYFVNLDFNIKFKIENINNKNFDYCVTINNEKLLVEMKNEVRPRTLAFMDALFSNQNSKILLVANYITPSAKEKLREHLINYIDSFGNAYFNLGDLKLFIEKGNAKPISKGTNEIFTSSGAKLLFELLKNSDSINTKTFRELAHICNISLGSVSKIMNGLQKEGYIIASDKTNVELIRKEALLDKWVNLINEKVLPTCIKGKYMFGRNSQSEWENINADIEWAGEPGAALLTNYLYPEKFSLFTDLDKIDLIQKVGLLPENQGNVTVYKPFWNENGINNRTVHPLLIYAQLMYDGNERNIETAKIIYNEYIQHNI